MKKNPNAAISQWSENEVQSAIDCNKLILLKKKNYTKC